MNPPPSTLTLAELNDLLHATYPVEGASSWDVVGLTVGKPEQTVTSVMWAVDPTYDVVMEAVENKADALITHHPLMLRGVTTLNLSHGTGRIVEALIRHNIGLICAHTNADVATPGVNDALAHACGITHPQLLHAGGDNGLGRWGTLPEPTTLHLFAQHLASHLPSSPAGIRISGDLHGTVHTVAVVGGSGDRFFDDAHRVNADVYVTADLRHHPVTDQRASVCNGKPFVIDAGHWATEWLWLHQAARHLQQQAQENGHHITSAVATTCTDPWTATMATTGPRRGHEQQTVGDV